MQDLNDKTSGSFLLAPEWNQVPSEIQNVIEGLGQTLSSGDLNQLGKAIAGYVANGTFFVESGAADAYVLSIVGSKQGPTAYTLGMKIRFTPVNSNTGASTVNVNGLGVKNIKGLNGGVLPPDYIVAGEEVEAVYDGTEFLARRPIVSSTVNHTTIAKMKADRTLQVGQIVGIEDYATGNNSGLMIGSIVAPATGTDDGGSFIDLDSTLQWKQNFRTDIISVKQFGAVGDGTADDTPPIAAAVLFGKDGKHIHHPIGNYKLTDEIEVHAGMTISGANGADKFDGAPPAPDLVPTFIFQTTNNKAIWIYGPTDQNPTFKNMALSPTLTPTHVIEATGKTGIKMEGSFPNFVWRPIIDNVNFYNFEFALSVIDPNAGTLAPPFDFDWSVAPANITNCRFQYPGTGVRMDTQNADGWRFQNCMFLVPSGGDGVKLERFGFLKFDTCFAGGETVSNNRWVNIDPDGTNAVDKISFDNCQAETLTQSIILQKTAVYSSAPQFTIECNNCIFELQAAVNISNEVHFISRNSRYAASIFVDNTNVKVSSYEDVFLGGADFNFLSGTPEATFVNLVHGPNPSPAFKDWYFENDKLVRRRIVLNVPNVTATTIYTLPAEDAFYEVFAYLKGSNNVLFQSTAQISCDNVLAIIQNNISGTGMVITLAGLAIQVTQNTGVAQDVDFVFRRLD